MLGKFLPLFTLKSWQENTNLDFCPLYLPQILQLNSEALSWLRQMSAADHFASAVDGDSNIKLQVVNGRWGERFWRNTRSKAIQTERKKREACQEGSAVLKHVTFIDIEETSPLVQHQEMCYLLYGIVTGLRVTELFTTGQLKYFY